VNSIVRGDDWRFGDCAHQNLPRDCRRSQPTRSCLRRVIENLVSNAVDSLEGKNGTVTITTERGKNIVRISVSDTGARHEQIGAG